MARTDIHRPAEFDPADYRVIDYLDNKRPEPPFSGQKVAWEAYECYVAIWQERLFEYFPDWKTGGDDHKSVHQCNHCGHPGIRWVAVVEHIPTGKKLAFGEICADRCELPGRDAFRAKFIKDRAARELAAFEKKQANAAFQDKAGDVVSFLEGLNDDYDSREPDFLLSLKAQLANKGTLSDAQVDAARKFLIKRKEWDAKKKAEAEVLAGSEPLVEGRREISGEIVSTKLQDSDYGSNWKMLVREDDGNKVWGTIPESLWSTPGINSDSYKFKGLAVTFTATVTRSKDDEHFGFFKRPTGAKALKGVVVS